MSRNNLDREYPYTFFYSNSCLHPPTFKSQATIVPEKSTVFTFSFTKAFATKFDLAVKQIKVNPSPSFKQTMIDWSPLSYMPSFVEIGPLALEKNMFEGFLPYMGVAAILVM